MRQTRLQITRTEADPLPIEKDRFALGSHRNNDLHLGGHGVSPHHAEILRREQHFLLRDLDSRGGTFVNGQRVRERVLVHGDRIRLAKRREELLFLLGEDETFPSSLGKLRGMTAVLGSLRVLGSASILEDVLERVLDAALEVTGAERAFVMLANKSGKLEHTVGRAADGVPLPGGSFDTSRLIPERVLATGQPEYLADLGDPGTAESHFRTMRLGIRGVSCLPLRVVRLGGRGQVGGEEARTIGVLYIDSAKRRAQLLSEPMREALDSLAVEAALAIDNADLYRRTVEAGRTEEDLRRAHEIQKALLPVQLNKTGVFRTAGTSLPCRAIGGDFLDFYEFSDGRLGLAVADVAGKGPPAAILAAHLQGLVTASVGDGGSPAEVLARANHGLLRRALNSKFATFLYAVSSPAGRLVWCNAGHPHPILLRRDGGVERLGRGGLPLGILEDARYEEGETTFSSGDVLVTFSDGVTDASNRMGEWFDEERLLAEVQQAAGWDPQAILDRILRALEDFTSGEPQADDITLLVVQRAPSEAGRV